MYSISWIFLVLVTIDKPFHPPASPNSKAGIHFEYIIFARLGKSQTSFAVDKSNLLCAKCALNTLCKSPIGQYRSQGGRLVATLGGGVQKSPRLRFRAHH